MSVVDDIKARLDVVETVSGYVALQKSGRYFKAPCPFHSEKTPSFIVNSERQSWRCFGACATGGDVFSFVMRMEGLDFSGALRILAQKAGVSLSQGGGAGRHERLYTLNSTAARFYHQVLESPQGRKARGYLERRGVDEEPRARFDLGLSPAGWDGLKSHLMALGFTEDHAVEAGLLHRGEKGNTWDFFRGRLMFPIHDKRGRLVGFGARALDDATPKYINTPKTPVFDKGGTLYALHLADEPIRVGNAAIVVEGYMDAIAAHQFGYTNVVASMGTALTEQQVSQLKPLATNFVLALDPDAAGQEATLRSLESSWRVRAHQAVSATEHSMGLLYRRKPLTLKIAALPPGKDPDGLIREDAQEWERLLREAKPLLDYYIEMVASRFDLETGEGKAQAVEVLAPMVVSADFVEQEPYMRQVAKALGVSEEALKATIGRPRAGGKARGTRRHQSAAEGISASLLASKPEDSLEDYILALLLSRHELKDGVRESDTDFFHKSEAREVFKRWLGAPDVDDLRGSIDASLHEYLDYLTRKELAPANRLEEEEALSQCLRRLERRHLQELQEALLASSEAGIAPPREMEEAVSSVNSRLKELFSQRTR